jgi:nucleoside-diphosphate-sugar epimerase
MRVLVTGHRGYIGVHLVDLLRRAGHEVTGCDLDLFSGCEWGECAKPDRELIKDVRRITVEDLDGHDCVAHLAAISNDPMGDLDPLLTRAVNLDASVAVARLAKQAGVPRFLFASSCSVYGKLGEAVLDEQAPLNPLSEYARSKIEAEDGIRALADTGFSPTFLRSATAYGHSPMLRIDIVANNLLAAAHATGQVRIMSDGSPWRPLIHCRDIARAFVAALEAPREELHNLAVNVGADDANYRVRDIAGTVGRLVPNADVVYTGEVGPDPRSYRVSFALLRRVLPDFELEYTLESGLAELDREMKIKGFGLHDFEGSRFIRLRALQSRLHLLGGSMPREASMAA